MQKKTSSRSGAFNPRLFLAFILLSIGASLAVAAVFNVQLVPGTAVLLDQSTSSGNGGNAKSTSSSTNIFSPAAFVDYKRFGGEPTVVVDRYPFPGSNTSTAAQCPPGQTTCFKDIAYQSAPQGFVFPRYSNFYKSDDLALDHITMNVSSDLGETWTTDDTLGTALNLVDDRQWVEADEAYPGTTA